MEAIKATFAISEFSNQNLNISCIYFSYVELNGRAKMYIYICTAVRKNDDHQVTSHDLNNWIIGFSSFILARCFV